MPLTIGELQRLVFPYSVSIRKEGSWWFLRLRGAYCVRHRELAQAAQDLLSQLGYRGLK